MAILRDGLNAIWNYVSPRKTQQRRDKEFKVPALPGRPTPLKKQLATPQTHSISPQSRVKSWKLRTPSPYTNLNMDMDETLLPPSPPESAKPMDDDFEGDTLLPESPSVFQAGSSGDEWDANRDTIVVDDDKYLTSTIDVVAERLRRDEHGRELREGGWSEDSIFLFQKLGLRGLEPLLPSDWIDDLETLPGDLFTANLDKAFLKPAHGANYNAQLALSNLFDLGGRARDALFTKALKRTPAYHIKRAVDKYTTWAMKDGQVDHIWPELPLFRLATFAKDVDPHVIELEMIGKLRDLRSQWQQALDRGVGDPSQTSAPEVPTIYGVTASHTIMAFVSYVPPTDEKEAATLRVIAMFDFGKDGYDVWNSLAIAIFVTHCRNRMMQLQEYIPEPQISSDEDPDA